MSADLGACWWVEFDLCSHCEIRDAESVGGLPQGLLSATAIYALIALAVVAVAALVRWRFG